ncbi:MAG: BPSS1780 family membrane protein [Casimicrobiaceae bacterium]
MSSSSIDLRVVEAGRGARWWVEGWHTFTSNLWTWIGLMIIFLIISMLISWVPYVGDVGHSLLAPVFIGGLMVGCHAIDRGRPLKVAHLFEGFQGVHFVPLLIIGAINIALTLLIYLIISAGFVGVSMMDMLRAGGGDPLAAFSTSATRMGFTGLLAIMAVLVIAAIMWSLNWLAPALVVLRGATAVEAMKASFTVCWRNWAPFLVYSLVAVAVVGLVLAAFAALALSFGISAFTTGGGIAGLFVLLIVFGIVVMLTMLFVGPTVFGTTYASYKDTVAGESGEVGIEHSAVR